MVSKIKKRGKKVNKEKKIRTTVSRNDPSQKREKGTKILNT